jgi:hypothetical protein
MMKANCMVAQELAWQTRRPLEQLEAVIDSAAELECFEQHLEGDFEKARVLLELSRDLVRQVRVSADEWDCLTAKLENQASSVEDQEPLPIDVVLGLLNSLVDYLRDGTSYAKLAEVATAIATRSDSDTEAMKLAAFVVGVLRGDGIQADLIQFPNGPQVIVWAASSSKPEH